jgi:hypothetical protein
MVSKNKSIDRKRKEDLNRFQGKVGIRFKSLDLLNTALSHKSYVNEADRELENNEKLEFLGDSFLGFVISDYLFSQNLIFISCRAKISEGWNPGLLWNLLTKTNYERMSQLGRKRNYINC